MSMYDSANRINVDLKQLFDSLPLNEFSKEQREQILNIMIKFGAVAKFRCRSNVAYLSRLHYENFVNACFNEIAKTEKVKIKETDEYEVLVAKMEERKWWKKKTLKYQGTIFII